MLFFLLVSTGIMDPQERLAHIDSGRSNVYIWRKISGNSSFHSKRSNTTKNVILIVASKRKQELSQRIILIKISLCKVFTYTKKQEGNILRVRKKRIVLMENREKRVPHQGIYGFSCAKSVERRTFFFLKISFSP